MTTPHSLGLRNVARVNATYNNGLEQTGPAISNGLGGPCSSIQCSTGICVKEE